MQTYDGASVMSGHIGGVQTLMHQQYPFAYFVHCAAHTLKEGKALDILKSFI